MRKDLPGKNLYILFDITRFWIWKAHDDFEKVLAFRFRFGNGQGAETFQVPADAILLLNCESYSNERFKKVNGINAGHIALLLAFPIDAANADAIRNAIGRRDRLEISMDSAATLASSEVNQSPLASALLWRPILGHGIQIAIHLQNSLGRIHGVGVERLIWTACACQMLNCRGPNESRVHSFDRRRHRRGMRIGGHG